MKYKDVIGLRCDFSSKAIKCRIYQKIMKTKIRKFGLRFTTVVVDAMEINSKHEKGEVTTRSKKFVDYTFIEETYCRVLRHSRKHSITSLRPRYNVLECYPKNIDNEK